MKLIKDLQIVTKLLCTLSNYWFTYLLSYSTLKLLWLNNLSNLHASGKRLPKRLKNVLPIVVEAVRLNSG